VRFKDTSTRSGEITRESGNLHDAKTGKGAWIISISIKRLADMDADAEVDLYYGSGVASYKYLLNYSDGHWKVMDSKSTGGI
jgi:hypothetical protein